MKNIFFICICALFAFTGCTDDDDELLANGDTNINLLPNPQPNGVINEKLFEVINLDYPGLEKVKEYYEANEYYYAAHELLKYYRNRSDVSNPNINLINPSITAFDQNIADQALEHRFYVRNFKEKEENGKEVYYLFDKDKKIDWTYIPAEITDQEFKSQTHRHQWMLPQAKAYRVNQNEKYIQSWIEVYSDWLNTFPCPEGTVSKDAVQWYGLQPAERVLDQIDIMPHFIQSTNCYTHGDLRLTAWHADNRLNKINLIKYKRSSSSENSDHYGDPLVPMLKLGEMYLIASEAALNDPSINEDPREILNTFKQNRKATEVALNATDDEIADEITHEYICEFRGEGQLFWYYKRINKNAIDNGNYLGTTIQIDPKAYTFPLPQYEIDFGTGSNH